MYKIVKLVRLFVSQLNYKFCIYGSIILAKYQNISEKVNLLLYLVEKYP